MNALFYLAHDKLPRPRSVHSSLLNVAIGESKSTDIVLATKEIFTDTDSSLTMPVNDHRALASIH